MVKHFQECSHHCDSFRFVVIEQVVDKTCHIMKKHLQQEAFWTFKGTIPSGLNIAVDYCLLLICPNVTLFVSILYLFL